MSRFTNADERSIPLPPVYGHRTHPLLPLRQALDPLISQIDELDEFIKIAKDACHYPSDHGLTREESASIYLYTMAGGEQCFYRVLNAALRNKDRSTLVPWHGYIKLFETALKKLPNLRMSLWRGVNRKMSQNLQEDEKLTWWSFTSCSSAVNVVKPFLGPMSTLLMVEAKNGKDISAYSNFPDEKEVILGLGTRLRTVSKPLKYSSLDVIHLVELSDENKEESSTFKVHNYADGDRYEGEWKNRRKHGKGSIIIMPMEPSIQAIGSMIKKQVTAFLFGPNNDRYEGQFKDGNFNGKGRKYFANGNQYTGDWINDKMTGHGIFTWPNNSRYEGQFKDGNFNGKGTKYFASGNRYTGDWINDKMAGHGIFTWPNGDRFEGQFEGQFADSKMNGKGKLYCADGQVQEGMWLNDNFIG